MVSDQGFQCKRLSKRLNALYRNMPQTDFTKGKEQAFEAVMMQWWTHSWDNDEIFWESYLNALEEKNY
jgi:hypothetical protein